MSKETKENILQLICFAVAGVIGWHLGKIYWIGLSLVIAAGIGLALTVAANQD